LPANEHIRLHNDLSFGDEFDPEEHSISIRAAFERLLRDPEWAGGSAKRSPNAPPDSGTTSSTKWFAGA
jgi:hypothetical protein